MEKAIRKKPIQISKAELVSKKLVHLFSVPVGPTNGIVTREQARRVFRGFPRGSRLLSWRSKATYRVEVAVQAMTGVGRFRNHYFGSVASELEMLRLQWSQVVRFCDDYSDKLSTGDSGTFFLITRDGKAIKKDLSNLYVAQVFTSPRRRRVFFRGYSHVYLKRASGHLFVSPDAPER